MYRARAAVFAELTWLILVSAWEFKSIRRSMFHLDPDSTHKFPIFADLWENKFLFWAVAIGAISVFPTVYIPVLNRNVFKHTGISWEWGVVFGMSIVYVVGVELWKLVKRRTGILDDHAVVRGKWSQGSEDGRKFTKTLSMGSLRSWKSWAKGDLSRGRSSTLQSGNGNGHGHGMPQGVANGNADGNATQVVNMV